MNNISRQTLIKGIIFGLLAMVVIGELTWSAFYLNKPVEIKSKAVGPKPTVVSPLLPRAEFVLVPKQKELLVGEELLVEIRLTVENSFSAGADAIINYDAYRLDFERLETGPVFSQYPVRQADRDKGQIILSGAALPENPYLGKDGLMARLFFKARAVGGAKISFDFTKGETTDSNVAEMETGKDLLDRVDEGRYSIR